MKDERDNIIDLVPLAKDSYGMSDDQRLVVYEPQPLTRTERLALYLEDKQQEFEEALKAGKVKDPVSILVSIGISVALSFASAGIARLLAPKPKPFRRGEMSGEVQGLMRSEQGILIPEIYGGEVGDGRCGVRLPAFILWCSKIRKQTHIETTSTGGGKGFGGPKTTSTEVVEYDLDFAAGGGRGPLRLKRMWANADKLIDLDKRGVYEGEDPANTLGSPAFVSSYEAASDGKDVTLQFNGSVQFNAVVSNGAATRDITIYYVNTATTSAEVTVNGVTTTVSFPNSSNDYRSVVISRALNNGNNVIKIKNINATFSLRIDRIFCFPGLTGEETTGILDETASADPNYSPTALPAASVEYNTPLLRHNAVPGEDGYESTTGTINLGGYANFATYKGKPTQQVDPVIQADIDGKYGAGSTPAYLKWAYARFSNFKLTRWGSVMPNITGLWENELYKNCGQIYGQWEARVGLLTTDYDVSGITTAKCRGLLVSGRRYAPKEVMTEMEEIYDIISYEDEGKIYSILQEDAPRITIPESEIGWSDEESDELPSLNTTIENEIDIPRRSTLKFIDPDREYEPNTQDEVRLITTGRREESLDVAITLTATEARAVTAKRLYRGAVEAVSHNFTLPWTYLYVHCGTIIDTTKNGIALSMQLTSMKGGISPLECEAVAVENAVLTQTASTSGGGVFEKPPVAIPTSSVMTILDLPPLRTADYNINQGGGDTIAVAPRSSTAKAWPGASVYMEEDGEYKGLVDFATPCVMGTVVGSQTLPDATTFTAAETGYTIDVDLFGSDAALANVTSTQAQNGTAGLYVIGNEAVGITTATKLSSSPNRWRLSGSFWRGRKQTTGAATGHGLNERVILINASVRFIPRDYLADRNDNRNYKAVTIGQSFDDASVVNYTWTGVSMEVQTPDPSAFSITFNGNALVQKVTLPTGTKYDEVQISLVNDENTFVDDGNRVFRGKALTSYDDTLAGDPRTGTRYARIIGLWKNPSGIISASYNVPAPAAPTVTNREDRVNYNLTVTAAGGYNTVWIKFTEVQTATDAAFSQNVLNKQYPRYMKSIKVPKSTYGAGKEFHVRVRFLDAFLDDPGAWSA